MAFTIDGTHERAAQEVFYTVDPPTKFYPTTIPIISWTQINSEDRSDDLFDLSNCLQHFLQSNFKKNPNYNQSQCSCRITELVQYAQRGIVMVG